MVALREGAKVSNARQGSSYLTVRSITAAASLQPDFAAGCTVTRHRVLNHPPVARTDGTRV